MPISSTSLNSSASTPAGSLTGQTQSPSAKPPRQDSQSSTVVTLSEQGKKLAQAQSQTTASSQASQAQSQATQNAQATHPPGIPAIEGDNRNGRISTYA